MKNSRIVLFHAMSPLHAGTGQGVGVIDLPVAREKSTNIPCVPGSSLKGALRSLCDPQDARAIFGPPPEQASDHAGSAHFSDLTLLLLPVRSLRGTFAWVTSAYTLRRLARDLSDVGLTDFPSAAPRCQDETRCLVAPKSALLWNQKVVLEDLDLQSSESSEVAAWADWLGKHLFQTCPQPSDWQTALSEQVCLVHDDTFAYLLETATEVVARIQLKKETRTVERGALWYEESLPVESILWGLVCVQSVQLGKDGPRTEPARALEILGNLATKPVQLGGSATVGRGLGRLHLVEVG